MRLSSLLWIFFFLFFLGVGFLHGYLPQGLSKKYLIKPTKIRILATDQQLFPQELIAHLEDKLSIQIEFTLSKDWSNLTEKIGALPSQDLVLLPSYWAATLKQKNLLANIVESNTELGHRISNDFLNILDTNSNNVFNHEMIDFFPLYWIKTGFHLESHQTFIEGIKNAKQSTLFLLADEDLILKHFQRWQNRKLIETILQKKILTRQLEQLNQTVVQGIAETAINEKHPQLETEPELTALLIWGAVIPANSEKKDLALAILRALIEPKLQSTFLMQTPLNSALLQLDKANIPAERKASHLRQLELKSTLLIDKKEIDAKNRLKTEFEFIF